MQPTARRTRAGGHDTRIHSGEEGSPAPGALAALCGLGGSAIPARTGPVIAYQRWETNGAGADREAKRPNLPARRPRQRPISAPVIRIIPFIRSPSAARTASRPTPSMADSLSAGEQRTAQRWAAQAPSPQLIR